MVATAIVFRGQLKFLSSFHLSSRIVALVFGRKFIFSFTLSGKVCGVTVCELSR